MATTARSFRGVGFSGTGLASRTTEANLATTRGSPTTTRVARADSSASARSGSGSRLPALAIPHSPFPVSASSPMVATLGPARAPGRGSLEGSDFSTRGLLDVRELSEGLPLYAAFRTPRNRSLEILSPSDQPMEFCRSFEAAKATLGSVESRPEHEDWIVVKYVVAAGRAPSVAFAKDNADGFARIADHYLKMDVDGGGPTPLGTPATTLAEVLAQPRVLLLARRMLEDGVDGWYAPRGSVLAHETNEAKDAGAAAPSSFDATNTVVLVRPHMHVVPHKVTTVGEGEEELRVFVHPIALLGPGRPEDDAADVAGRAFRTTPAGEVLARSASEPLELEDFLDANDLTGRVAAVRERAGLPPPTPALASAPSSGKSAGAAAGGGGGGGSGAAATTEDGRPAWAFASLGARIPFVLPRATTVQALRRAILARRPGACLVFSKTASARSHPARTRPPFSSPSPPYISLSYS